MDKLPDYTKYGLDELYDVYHHIDRSKYPETFEIVVQEIKKREKDKPIEKNDKYKIYIRDYWVVLVLGIVTLGIYFLYWYYTNLNEIKISFNFHDDEKEISYAQTLFWIIILFGCIGLLVLFYVIKTSSLNEFETNPNRLLLTLFSSILNAVFIFYFTKTVLIAQKKSQIEFFKFSQLYKKYIIGAILSFLGFFIIIFSLIGSIFIIIFYYNLQKEINRIWIEGQLTENV